MRLRAGATVLPACAMLTAVDRLYPYRRLLIAALHLVLLTAAYLLAFQLRFQFPLGPGYLALFAHTLPLLLVARSFAFAWYRLHEGLWRYVSVQDILTMLKAVTLGSLLFMAGVLALFGHGFPRSVFILEWLLCLASVGGVRLGVRVCRESRLVSKPRGARRALIVGAGDAGEALLREIARNRDLSYEVVGFVDDDRRKRGRRIHGVEVDGTVDELPSLCQAKAVEQLVIAMPSVKPAERRRILERCRETGVPFKTVPPLDELLQGRARIGHIQEVLPEDLLGREGIRLDLDQLRWEIRGRHVLVTGAAGSIGSELCRQLAAFEPATLVLFDRSESNLYFVALEMRRSFPAINVVSIVGDILDWGQLEEVVRCHAPDLVYHAAAYKHVPLLEEHPLEAILNNIFGTQAVAAAAQGAGARKFVLVSTDKAVRPVSIMGMTKRVAECLVQACDEGPTSFVAVRFGNVLGSDGSVLPLFRWQIASGGPLTVTDAEATRYFMLLSEAAQLVLQAGAIGKGGEVFFLDMGQPVRILDLAQNLVRLAGMEPGKDIRIELTGLRPGERLNEELIVEGEELLPTGHEKVLMAANHRVDRRRFAADLAELRRLVGERDREGSVRQLRAMAARY